MEVQRFLGPHGHSKQDPEEPEVLQILWRVAAGVEHKTVCVEATFVGGISRGNQQLEGSIFEFLFKEDSNSNCVSVCYFYSMCNTCILI